ncbi:Glycoside hydrolase 18 protein [Metarhizium rileyi]|uniref:Glycoside hydrolase 18 protein n=1 Tax=Metarhizium rileyi (strain RCEF 4871) TaxID=1649241 RepID=A0A5C6GKU4_METRR|nr:Glycoside hydrolase 18 protein [Metarhizium rileyi]
MALSLGPEAGVIAPGLLHSSWGQDHTARLSEVCNSGVDYVTISLNDHSGGQHYEEGVNFALFCFNQILRPGSSVYREESILKQCELMRHDAEQCRQRGVKILLGIGDEPEVNDVLIKTTMEEGKEFAEALYEKLHTYVDGFHLDLHSQPESTNEAYIAMVDFWRARHAFIAATPVCIMDNEEGRIQEDDLIGNAQFDALFLSLYNDPICIHRLDIPSYEAADGGFLRHASNDTSWLNSWTEQIAYGKSRNAKLFINLPASEELDRSRYHDRNELKEVVCKLSAHENFGGISVWKSLAARTNINEKGENYLQVARQVVKNPCREPSTTISPTSSSKKVFSKVTSTKSSIQHPSISGTNTAYVVGPTSSGTVYEKPSNSSAISASSKKLDATNVTASAMDTPSSSSSFPRASLASSSRRFDSTVAKPTQTVDEPSLPTTERSDSMNKCPPGVAKCFVDHAKTKSSSLYTPAEESAKPLEPTVARAFVTTKSPVFITSTIYTTTTYTVYSCLPTVTNCRLGDITSKIVVAYHTSLPVEGVEAGKGLKDVKPARKGKVLKCHESTNNPQGIETGKGPQDVKPADYLKGAEAVKNVKDVGAVKGPQDVSPADHFEDVKPVKVLRPQPQPAEPARIVPSKEIKILTGQATMEHQRPGVLETSVQPAAVVAQPSAKDRSYPGCSDASNTSAPCSGVVVPNGPSEKPGAGCSGPNCPAVTVPKNSWAVPHVDAPAATGSNLIRSASTLALGLLFCVVVVVV